MLVELINLVKKANYKYFSKERYFIERLNAVLGFTPVHVDLFKIAFYHKSTINNNQQTEKKSDFIQSNERLEYLGDALLSFVVGEYLFNKYVQADEGFLTKMRSKIVKRKMLNYLAEQMGLDRILMEFNQASISPSMLGNALEALIGAIYLEKGFSYTRKYILNGLIKKYINIHSLESFDDNYKSQLLEWCQKNTKEVDFRVLSKTKNDKRDRFRIGVYIDGIEIATAEDYNKKSAEQVAAEIALTQIQT
ncbi:MAG: ribonuclease III [Saprospiraceae bacterium]